MKLMFFCFFLPCLIFSITITNDLISEMLLNFFSSLFSHQFILMN